MGNASSKIQKISQYFDPQFYNYYDYETARMNAFRCLNSLGKHFWLILSEKQLVFKFCPMIFTSIKACYGPKVEILPPSE